jgi:choline dehydrogenase-like flavoprotein
MSTTNDADVIIVGAGISGAMVAEGLAKKGVKVLVLESGPMQDRQQAVEDYRAASVRVPEAAYPDVPYAPRAGTIDPGDYYVQQGWGFRSNYERRVGGATWHWLGTALRLLPSDFRMKTDFGAGVDWPISYNELEPWYGKAEYAIGVSGEDVPQLGSPRSTPYPMPPIPQSYMDKVFKEGAATIGLVVNSTPQARNSVARDGRPPCCGNSSCVPICPIGAKYDGTVHVKKAQAAGATSIASAVVVDVQVQPGTATVTYRPSGGDPITITSHTVVIAASAIEAAKLMLMSKSDTQPEGLGNANDLVGRFLMDHPVQLAWGLLPQKTFGYRGPGSTSGIDQVRDGAFRSKYAPFRPEIHNDAWTWMAGDQTAQAATWAQKGEIEAAGFATFTDRILRQALIASCVEQDPLATNRVTLSSETDAIGVPRPAITYEMGEYTTEGSKAARRLHLRVLQTLGATDVQQNPIDQFQGAGHNIGTTRMGNDPKQSVVDKDLRVHGTRNCFVVGTSPMPTSGTANPTLTVAALALRAVEPIRKSLTEG